MVERSQRWKHRIMKRRRNRSEREGDKEREIVTEGRERLR